MDASMARAKVDNCDHVENCDDKAFLKLRDELLAKMYPEQANAVEAAEGKSTDETFVTIDRGLPATIGTREGS